MLGDNGFYLFCKRINQFYSCTNILKAFFCVDFFSAFRYFIKFFFDDIAKFFLNFIISF